MKLSYQEFLLTKLSQTDLDKFADLLNELNVNYNKVFEQKIQAKRQLSANEITKDEYKTLSKVVDEAKKNYRQAAKTTAFKDNYSNIKKIYRQTKETDQDFPAIKADYLFAKDLYAKAKETIKIKGKVRTISKLNDVAIKIDDLSYKYSPNLPYALKKVNLEVKTGEYVAIIGHNGSGKSTLSKLIIGVLNSKEGSISVFGNTLTSATIDRIRQFLGIVFQNPDNQFIGATVKDDIAFGLENKQVDPKLMPEIIDNAAKRVNMLNYLEKEPLSLSGGQKQRVAIASALALNPDIIIFDEATSMLDPKGKNEIKEIMVDLQKNDHKTIISITHDMDEIMNATQVVVMNQGEVVRIGTPEVIMKDKEFLRSMHLEIPFLGAVQEALEKQNIKVSDPKNLEQLVEELWQQI